MRRVRRHGPPRRAARTDPPSRRRPPCPCERSASATARRPDLAARPPPTAARGPARRRTPRSPRAAATTPRTNPEPTRPRLPARGRGSPTRSRRARRRASPSLPSWEHAYHMKTLEMREAETQTRTPFQGKDVLAQVVIAALAVAPDASSIVYSQRTVEDGRYRRNLWRTDFERRTPDRLTTARANDWRPRFSPDGTRLAFLSDRSGKPQVWAIHTRGGEPEQVTDLPGGVGAMEWSPDGTRLLLVGGSGEHRFLVGDEKDPTAWRVRDYTWRFDGHGIRDQHASLWIIELADPKPKRITDAGYGVDGAAWSPDGERIAFLADRGEARGLEEIDQLWTIDAAGGEPKHVAKLGGGLMALAWAPGKEIAYLGIAEDGAPGWADVGLYVAGRRLAADGHLNVQVTSYGDYQDGEQHMPQPPVWLDDEN